MADSGGGRVGHACFSSIGRALQRVTNMTTFCFVCSLVRGLKAKPAWKWKIFNFCHPSKWQTCIHDVKRRTSHKAFLDDKVAWL